MNISNEIIMRAVKAAVTGHRRDVRVREFLSDIDNNVAKLRNLILSDKCAELIQYRELTKEGINGKIRKIKQPSFLTRLLQHIAIVLVNDEYCKHDNRNGFNCKKGFGIASKQKGKSLLNKLKTLFYRRRDLNYAVVVDMRQCYAHVRPKMVRRALKELTRDKDVIDFFMTVVMYENQLPIGTPSSPLAHHIMMLAYDRFAKNISPFSVRYADDNLLAFSTLEEAQRAKWRIKNYWWYNCQMRAKRHTARVVNLEKPLDFCGYIFHRTAVGGYVTIRKNIRKRVKKMTRYNWAAYYGMLLNQDDNKLIEKLCKKMELRELTNKVRIERKLDAPNIAMKDIEGELIIIQDYAFKTDRKTGEVNWVKLLIGFPENGRWLAREVHGSYPGLIEWLLEVESSFGNRSFLPIKNARIVNQCGYIFEGSSQQLEYL